MSYECEYFKITGCVDIANPRPASAQLELFDALHTTYLDIDLLGPAGPQRIVASGPSRTEALFAALAQALGAPIRQRAAARKIPPDAEEYSEDIRAVAEIVRAAKQSLSAPSPAGNPARPIRRSSHDPHLTARGVMREL